MASSQLDGQNVHAAGQRNDGVVGYSQQNQPESTQPAQRTHAETAIKKWTVVNSAFRMSSRTTLICRVASRTEKTV